MRIILSTEISPELNKSKSMIADKKNLNVANLILIWRSAVV